MSGPFDSKFWQAHYSDPASEHRGGDANPSLVTAAADLPPGLALDAGCGRGADAIWLASRGWQVTAVDVSPSALSVAQRRAALVPDVGDRIDWLTGDLTAWAPPRERFDLVTSHYVHVPAGHREALTRRLARAVAPGGVLLLVGHDALTSRPGAHTTEPEAYDSAGALAVLLHPAGWIVEVAESRTRTAPRPHAGGEHGHDHAVLHDAVLLARRVGGPGERPPATLSDVAGASEDE